MSAAGTGRPLIITVRHAVSGIGGRLPRWALDLHGNQAHLRGTCEQAARDPPAGSTAVWLTLLLAAATAKPATRRLQYDIVQECLASGKRAGPVQVGAINRIGRTITCMVVCSPLKVSSDGDKERDGAVLLMEEFYPS
jgi:hypothetical protein